MSFATAPPSREYLAKLKADKEDLNRRIRERDARGEEQKRQHKQAMSKAKKTLEKEAKSHARAERNSEELADALYAEQVDHETSLRKSEALLTKLEHTESENNSLHAQIRSLNSRLELANKSCSEARELLAVSRARESSAREEAARALATIQSLEAERTQRDVQFEIMLATLDL